MGLAERRIDEDKVGGPDPKKRDALVLQHLPYVKRIVQRISAHLPAHVEIDDLMHAGVVGLLEAADRYDSERENKFTTYAVFRIRGAVLSELRSRDFLSRSARRRLREFTAVCVQLEQSLGREARDEEIAEMLGVDVEEVFQLKKMSGIAIVSLDEVGRGSLGEKESLLDYLIEGGDLDALSLARLKEIETGVAKAIEELPEKEKMVISLYYWDELTMKEIGNVLDITESRVSQLHSQAVKRLRVKLYRDGVIG